MKISTTIVTKEFSHAVSKEAYLMACRWMAEHVVSKVETAPDVYFNIIKKPGASLPTFILEVTTMLDVEEHQEKFCQSCREFNSAFFMNKTVDCNACKYNAFTKQVDQRLTIKKQFKKERMELS